MELKHCYCCKRDLPLDSFNKNKSKKDGLATECKECGKVKSKKYRDNNTEKLKEQKKEYYQENKNRIIENVQEWQSNNQDLVKQYKKKNYEENKDKYHENANLRYHTEEGKLKHQVRMKRYSQTEKGRLTNVTKRARRKNKSSQLPSSLTVEDWISCQNHFEHKCCYCGKELKLEQDHFVALSNGGEYTKNNIVPACKSCNSSKNNDDFFEWYKTKPFYSTQREQKILKYLNYKNKIQQLTLI